MPALERKSLSEVSFAQAVYNPVEIGRVLVGQDFAPVLQRIIGVDLEHFLPLPARFREAAK